MMQAQPPIQVHSADMVYTVVTPAQPDDTQAGICFATRSSGLYRSLDGGQTWQFAYESLNFAEPLLTTYATLSPDFATDHTLFAGAPGGVLRSKDGGDTWQITMLPAPPSPTVSTLAISPNFSHDGILLAGTVEDGVFRSTDQGQSWENWNFGLLDLNVITMAMSPTFAQDETLFVGTESGIFRSKNGGRAWREVAFPIDFAPVVSLAVSPAYSEDGTLFAGTEACGLFYSTDKGKSWDQLGTEAITGAVNAILLAPDFPKRVDILVLLDTTLLISRDKGQSWQHWQAGLSFESDATSVAAPQGLQPGRPLLVGLVGGEILQV